MKQPNNKLYSLAGAAAPRPVLVFDTRIGFMRIKLHILATVPTAMGVSQIAQALLLLPTRPQEELGRNVCLASLRDVPGRAAGRRMAV